MRIYFLYSLIPIYLCIYLLGTYAHRTFYYLAIIAIPITLLGFRDIIQKRSIILRNFPVIGHFRFLLEGIRPEIQQYFIERYDDGKPFSREQRSVVYQRAKGDLDTSAFGTLKDVYQIGSEWLIHSITTAKELHEEPRIRIGGKDCKQPYEASLFNLSAMSYGSLSKSAILAMNQGAALGGFYHNTGEGGISAYHLQYDCDLVWQIGTAYFGCRNDDGSFNESMFRDKAQLPQVKMIEIKLSQGAKPGHGGMLPKEKVTKEVAQIRAVPMDKDILSPPSHSAFNTPEGLLHFIAKLRDLSGGKPVGIKLCIGKRREFYAICKAMLKTDILPDFITIDGSEGGTGAAPKEFANHIGTPLHDALNFVQNALVGCGLRDRLKIIASGKVIDGFTMITKFALGADLCNSARGMMFAAGCIQALRCNSNDCPTGIATQDPRLYRLVDIDGKARRIARYHKETIKQTLHMMAAMGINQIDDIAKNHIIRRMDVAKTISYEEIYPVIGKGDLLTGNVDAVTQARWNRADPSTFEAVFKN